MTAWIVGVALVAISLGGPLILHFAQKRHNRLTFDIAAQYPPERELVGGEVFASAIIAIVDHELEGRTGWRPNDFFLWGPGLWADNNANRQRGIIQATRESLRVLKDHLTKISSDEYDRNLVAADNAFRNDMEKLWLPSAESKLREGTRALRAYVDGLAASPPKSRPINRRNMELFRLFQAWGDLLGDAHGSLYRSGVGMTQTDDIFYHSQGVTHAIAILARAVQREYGPELSVRPMLPKLLSEVADALDQASQMKPLIILDGDPNGIFANHRRNLDAYITEARQKIYSIREELEK